MEKVAFRKLFNQFGDLISPHWYKLDNTINNWIDANPALTGEHRVKLKQGCFGSLIARFYPSASYHHLITSSRVMLFFFLNDDNYHLHDPEQLREVHDKFIAALNGKLSDNDELCAMLHNIRNELIIGHRSVTWMSRFIASWELYLEGVRMEAPFRLSQKVPPPDEYYRIRSRSIGTDVCYDLIELVENIELTTESLQHPVIRELKQLATHIIFLDNDLVSVKKEAGDTLNAVVVLQHSNGTNEETAFQHVIDLRNTLLNNFEDLLYTSTATHFNWQDDIKKYLHGLRKMVLGNYCWQCLDTGRYTLDS